MQAALERDIQETLSSWRQQLSEAALILIHAPSANATPLFGGERPVLERSDPRVRPVPFTTRRPTFSETKRVLISLLSVHSASLPVTGLFPARLAGKILRLINWLVLVKIVGE